MARKKWFIYKSVDDYIAESDAFKKKNENRNEKETEINDLDSHQLSLCLFNFHLNIFCYESTVKNNGKI